MREIFKKTPDFDFLGKKKIFFPISLLLIIGTFVLWYSKGPSKYGVDFLGGNEILVQFTEKVTPDQVRSALEKGGVEEPTVQGFEASSNQFSIRTSSVAGGESSDAAATLAKQKVEQSLKTSFGDKYTIIKTDSVGPTVSGELRTKALIAVALGLLGMLLYVSLRFELAFAVGAVVAVFHDVLISLGWYLLAGHEINISTLAAVLTIVGYSMNDTIIIFDRVRDELAHARGTTLSELVNKAINATLSRSVITQVLTLFSVTALLLLGGGVISDLSFFLFIGMVCGFYSTIYIASPVMIWFHKVRGGTEELA